MATAKQLAALKKARAAKKKKISVNAKSRATGLPPTKRLKARRKKNLTAPKGYYPNPVKRKKSAEKFVVEVKLKHGSVGYLTPSGNLDTEKSKAAKRIAVGAEKLATEFFRANKRYLTHVKVVPAKM